MKFISHANKPQENTPLKNYLKLCREVIVRKDYYANEASLCVVDDEVLVQSAIDLAEKKKSKNLNYIVVVGIGGSNLGTKAIYDALFGTTDNLLPHRYPKMVFLDTTDPEYLAHFSSFFEQEVRDPGEIVVAIISKSGGTTETAVNGEVVIELLKKKFAHWQDRCVVISEKESLLWKNARALGIDCLENPAKVGGRYSVFSPVGLFPLSLCGVDIKKITQAASAMRDLCLSEEGNSPAIASALVLSDAINHGLCINDNFYFHTELESMGKWYRQLMGESTGKNGKGLTPTVSIGSVDLHSVVQLYLGGPKNKITSFVYTETYTELKLPNSNTLTHIAEIQGRKMGEIMDAIQKGTMKAYEKSNLPFTETILLAITESEIAAYMQFKMIEIMLLGNLMQVNAFDQPQVELYKIETKKILEKK